MWTMSDLNLMTMNNLLQISANSPTPNENELVDCMKKAASFLSQPPPKRAESPDDDVGGFCKMLKHDLRTMEYGKRRRLMHEISGMVLDAMEPSQPTESSDAPVSYTNLLSL